MIDGIIWSVAMGAVSIWGVLDQNREERREMKKRHDRRFKEIKENNKRRKMEGLND